MVLGVFEVVVDASHLKGSAHQIATIGGRNLVNLKGVIVAVGELQLDRLTALSTGLYGFSREQGVTLRCCRFLDGYGGIQRVGSQSLLHHCCLWFSVQSEIYLH